MIINTVIIVVRRESQLQPGFLAYFTEFTYQLPPWCFFKQWM